MHEICFTFFFILSFPCFGWLWAILLSVDAEWLCVMRTYARSFGFYIHHFIIFCGYFIWYKYIARASRVRYFTARRHPYVCESSGGWICVCEHIACPSDERQNSRQNKLEKYSRTIAHRSFNMNRKMEPPFERCVKSVEKKMGQIGINGVMAFRFVWMRTWVGACVCAACMRGLSWRRGKTIEFNNNLISRRIIWFSYFFIILFWSHSVFFSLPENPQNANARFAVEMVKVWSVRRTE